MAKTKVEKVKNQDVDWSEVVNKLLGVFLITCFCIILICVTAMIIIAAANMILKGVS